MGGFSFSLGAGDLQRQRLNHRAHYSQSPKMMEPHRTSHIMMAAHRGSTTASLDDDSGVRPPSLPRRSEEPSVSSIPGGSATSNQLRPPSPQRSSSALPHASYAELHSNFTASAASSVASQHAGGTLEGKIYGTCLARSSSRSMILKDWKPCFWVLENPNVLMIFRSAENYRGYHENALISPQERQLLVKSRVELSVKFLCKPVTLKDYSGGRRLHTFAIQERTDFGPLIAIKFASTELNTMLSLRNLLMALIPAFSPQPLLPPPM